MEVKTHGETYVIQAWNKGTSTSMDLERHCGPEDLKKLEIEGKEKRKMFSGAPNLLTNRLRSTAGNGVRRKQRLLKKSVFTFISREKKLPPLRTKIPTGRLSA